MAATMRRALLSASSRFRQDGLPQPARVIEPGHAEASVLTLRMRTRNPRVQMPPLGTAVPDTAALAIIEQWIDQELVRDAVPKIPKRRMPPRSRHHDAVEISPVTGRVAAGDAVVELARATLVTGALALVSSVAASSAVAAEPAATPPAADKLARGKYLVTIAGCNDCHTPLKPGPHGAEPDMTRMLSGHPEQIKVTAPADPQKEPWLVSTTGDEHRVVGPVGSELHGEPYARCRDGPWPLDVS